MVGERRHHRRSTQARAFAQGVGGAAGRNPFSVRFDGPVAILIRGSRARHGLSRIGSSGWLAGRRFAGAEVLAGN
jgi:hypothetical protein